MTAIERQRRKRLAALAVTERSVPISFAIVGVQKAGTTSLYLMLTKHRQIVAGPQKELRFFIEPHDWEHPDYSTYRRPVKGRGTIAGDATPGYLFYPGAIERMHRYDPDLKLMASFRDPIERAFSQWAMERERHVDYPDLPETIDRYGADPLPEPVPADRSPSPLLQRSPFARGLYGAQLERGLALFPAEQWLLFEFREITGDHERSLDRATDHLGIERFETYPGLDHRMATPTTNDGTAPSVAAIEGLVQHYADDLALFERLSGIDTSRWSTRRVIDGTLEVEEFHATLCAKLGLAT